MPTSFAVTRSTSIEFLPPTIKLRFSFSRPFSGEGPSIAVKIPSLIKIVLNRALRDHPEKTNTDLLQQGIQNLTLSLNNLLEILFFIQKEHL